jgi:putative ABC transport system permease protein
VTDGPTFGWALCAALAILLGLAVLAVGWGRLHLTRDVVVAAVRAIVQLLAVSAVIGFMLQRISTSLVFTALMFSIAVWTASGRIAARGDWLWVAVAIAAGSVPVTVVIFASGAAPFTGPAIIPIAGIVIGGSMTAHSLVGRRAFDALRSDIGQIEAGLAVGLLRRQAIDIVINRHAPEALVPVLDQTRTVGLVTLPGAFVGVLLGGGSAADAAATQVLVLVGLVAAEAVVVVVTTWAIAGGHILSADLRSRLPAL